MPCSPNSFPAAGWLVLTRLLVGDEPVAWNYGFQFAGSWFYYQPTFDARWRQYSPGFCLLTKMVEQACDDPEIQFLDLGLGEEGYKERFANGHRQTLHATITNSEAVASPGNSALPRGVGGKVLAPAGALGATVGGPAFRGKCKSMRVLLLHPEDELPAERTAGKWDLVVDLGRAPLATYERWGDADAAAALSVCTISPGTLKICIASANCSNWD